LDEEIKIHINRCKLYIDFMLSHHQWTGIHKEDVNRWINNFSGLSDDIISFAYTLLVNIIYYSEADIIVALKEGVKNLLFKEIILQEQKKMHFRLSPQALYSILNDELRASYFIPLLDKNAPHESSNFMLRLLTQNNIIEANQSVFLRDLKIERSKYIRIVIVDDCVGSGDQLIEFWSRNAKINIDGSEYLLRDYCKLNQNIEVNYLTLFGYENNINALKNRLLGIKVFCVNLLLDKQRVFSNESYIWQGEELFRARAMLECLLNEKGVPLLGYKDLDFAFIMDKTIPDWSLPMLYKETSDWKPLLRRKSTI